MSKRRKKVHNYPSAFAIDEFIAFNPQIFDTEEANWVRGQIIGIEFTRAKVFYTIVDDYHGEVFKKVDSIRVKALNSQKK